MRERKNWVDKSARSSYHDKTTLEENIAQNAEIFRKEKCSFSHNNDNNELLIIMIISSK